MSAKKKKMGEKKECERKWEKESTKLPNSDVQMKKEKNSKLTI
jgi:hypothetical protein